MLDNWSYTTVQSFPYCGFGLEIGFHYAKTIIIENFEVRGYKHFYEVDFYAYLANLGLSYNSTSLSELDISERTPCTAILFRFTFTEVDIYMTNVTQSDQQFQVSFRPTVLMYYIPSDLDLFIYGFVATPSLTVINLEISDILCVTECALFWIERVRADVTNLTFSNIKLLQEGSLIEVSSIGFYDIFIKDVTVKDVQAQASKGLIILGTTNPITVYLSNFSFTNCSINEQLFLLQSSISKPLSASIQGFQAHNLTFNNDLSPRIFSVSSLNLFELAAFHWTLLTRQDYFLISATGTNSVLIADCQLEVAANSVSSQSLFKFTLSSPQETVTIRNSTFRGIQTEQGEGGVFFAAGSGSLLLQDSYFVNCSAFKGGVLFVNELVTVQVSNSTFEANSAQNSAGVFYMSGSSKLLVQNSTFLRNEALDGGVALFTMATSFSFSDSLFRYNSASQNSAVALALNSQAVSACLTQNETSSFVRCSFLQNSSLNSVVYFFFSSAEMESCLFSNNHFFQSSSVVSSAFSSLQVRHSQFKNDLEFLSYFGAQAQWPQSKMQSRFISLVIEDKLTLVNSTFQGGIGDSGSTIEAGSASQLSLSNCSFTRNYGDGGAIRANLASSLSITDSTFTTNKGAHSNIYLNRLTTEATIQNSTFTDSEGSALFSTETNLTFSSNQIARSDSPQQSSLELEATPWANISGNSFSDLNVLRAVTVRSSAFSAEQKGAIAHNNLTHITGHAPGAGVALFQSSHLAIQDNSFFDLSFSPDSSQQEGAALYADQATSNATISNNSFELCRAQVGGAIKLSNLFNSVQDNHFSGNEARLYGANVASIPVELRLMEYEELPTAFQLASPRNLVHSRQLQTLQGARSGGTIDSFYLALVDESGSVVTSTFDNYVTFVLRPGAASSFTPNFQSPSALAASYGVFDLQSVIFFGEPGSSVLLTATTDAIDLSLAGSQSSLYELELEIDFRNCQTGEAFTDDGRCEECPADRYLLEAPSQVTSCQKCPLNALCLGGDRVTPLPGYWRPHAQSLQLISCFTPSACLGSTEDDYSPTGHCLQGYRGVLCAQCEQGFVRNSSFQCARCPDQWKNILLLIFIALLTLTAIVVLIKLTLKTAANKNSGFSVFFKIISSHFQLIVLAISLELEWPSSVQALHSSIEPVANVASKIVSFDCFLGTQQDQVKNVYVYFLVYLLLPLLLIGGALLFWRLKYLSQSALACSRSLTTVVILFFLVHPSITIAIFSIFKQVSSHLSSCRSIDSKLRLLSDLDIFCYQGTHTYWALIGGTLGLLLWVVGIPWLGWHLLREHRLRLQNSEIREKFGFLYNGYRLKRYYWESVVMLRKVVMIFISVFLRSQGTRIQALTVFLFLLFAAIFTLKQKPYVKRQMNNLEILSLVTSCITIYCGFFFLSHKVSSEPTFDPSKDFQLNEETKWFFFTSILFSNLAFFSAWVSVMAQELKGTCQTKYPHCYLCCCLCNRKDLFKMEQKASKVKLQLQDFVQEIQDISETLGKAKNKLLESKLFIDQKKFAAYVHYSRRILRSINFEEENAREGKSAGKYRTKNESKEQVDDSGMNFSVANEFSLEKSQNTEIEFVEAPRKEKRKANALKRLRNVIHNESQDSSAGLNQELRSWRSNRLKGSSIHERQTMCSDVSHFKRNLKEENIESEVMSQAGDGEDLQEESQEIISFFNSVEEVNPQVLERVVKEPKSARIASSFQLAKSNSKVPSYWTDGTSNMRDCAPGGEEENLDFERVSKSEAHSPKSSTKILFYPQQNSLSVDWEVASTPDEEPKQEIVEIAHPHHKKAPTLSKFRSFRQTPDQPK